MTTVSQSPPPARNSDDEDAPRPSLLGNVNLSDPQVRGLRIAVIVMGVMIVLGLLAVIGRIIYLVGRPAGQASVASGKIAAEVVATLPAGATVKSIAFQGDRLAIHYDAPTGTGIVIVDLATGGTIGRVRTAPQAPGQ